MKWTYHKIVTMRSPRARIGYSAVSLGRAEVVYRKGQWARAPQWLAKLGYHLLAFDSLEHARRFYESEERARRFYESESRSGGPELQIWRVHVRAILPDIPRIADVEELAHHGRITLLRDDQDHYWPFGTVMVKQIRLVECVYRRWQWCETP